MRPRIGFVVSVRDGVASYARIASPDPAALGCAPIRDATAVPPLPVDVPEPAGAEPCAAHSVRSELDRAYRRREIAPWMPLAGVFLVWTAIGVVVALHGGAIPVAAAVVLSVAATWIAFRIARRVDAARGSALLVYRLDEDGAGSFAELQRAVHALAGVGRVWHVPFEGRLHDSRQKYGARRFVRRYRIRPGISAPPRTLVNIPIPTIYGESRKYFFLPDRILVYGEGAVRELTYERLAPRTSEVLVVEDEDVPSDARVVESTWLYRTSDGTPDPAIPGNRRYPILLYGAVEFTGPVGLADLFHASVPSALDRLAAAIDAMTFREADAFPSGAEDSTAEQATEGESPGDEEEDELYVDVLRFVASSGVASVNAVASKFGIGFARAARLVATLENEGFVGPPRPGGQRDVRRAAARVLDLLDRLAGGSPGGTSASGGRRARPRSRQTRRPRGRALEPHEVLGVDASATRTEILEAYRELAQLYHPDKVATLAPEFQDLAEHRMKEINAAYATLMGAAGTGQPTSGR